MKTSFIFSVLFISSVVHSQPKDSLLTNNLRFFSPDSASLYFDPYIKTESCRLANSHHEYASLIFAAAKNNSPEILTNDLILIADQECQLEIMRRHAILPPPKWIKNSPPMLNLTSFPGFLGTAFK